MRKAWAMPTLSAAQGKISSALDKFHSFCYNAFAGNQATFYMILEDMDLRDTQYLCLFTFRKVVLTMKSNKSQSFPIPALREELRQRANALTSRLSRSVARLTSCEPLPCLEYGDEVAFQRSLAQQLFYLQDCRDALERCIGGRRVTLRYRWSGGIMTRTTFRKVGPNQVRVTGLLDAVPAAPRKGA